MSLLKEYAPRLYQTALKQSLSTGIEATDGWKADYRIIQFLPNTDRFLEEIKTRNAGRLSLEYRKQASGIELTVDHLNLAHPADADRCHAVVRCTDNLLCSPLHWELTQQFEQRQDPEHRTGRREQGRIGNGMLLCNGCPAGTLSSSNPCTSDYTLFAAMPALFTEKALPSSFDMLEALAVARAGQRLFRSGEVVLPDGRILTEIAQEGTGILAWFWWLDESGFPVACIREHYMFVLQGAGGSK